MIISYFISTKKFNLLLKSLNNKEINNLIYLFNYLILKLLLLS